MKKIAAMVALSVAGMGLAIANGGYANGPLTQSNGGGAVTQPQRLPAPGSLQFQGEAGGAPTATASAPANLQQVHLPPVVEAKNSIVLSGGNRTEPSIAAPANAITTQSNNSVQRASANVVSDAGSSSSSTHQDEPLPSRVTRLEQQISNLTQMNLPQQIANLQTQLQQLNGQMQVQEHDIKLLDKQQRTFYKDLDQRIKELGNGNSNGNGSANLSSNQDLIKHDLKKSTVALQESNIYKSAFDLLLKRQYLKAQKQLNKYVSTYPNGQFVVNAHYWLGEVYLIQQKFDQAKTEFNTVIAKAPKSPRVPDARLKIATIHLKQGQRALAKSELTSITKSYPDTTAAQLAAIQLKQISLK